MYKQPVERVVGRVHTQHYRIHGTLFPRPQVGMPDQLNRNDQPYIPIEDPRIYDYVVGDLGSRPPQVTGAFIAVPRESILWAVGGDAGSSDIRDFAFRDVAMLYGHVFLKGRLRVGSGMRTSDYIRNRVVTKAFDSLFDVSVSRLEGGGSLEDLEVVETFEFVSVNLRLTTGVVELDVSDERPESEGGEAS